MAQKQKSKVKSKVAKVAALARSSKTASAAKGAKKAMPVPNKVASSKGTHKLAPKAKSAKAVKVAVAKKAPVAKVSAQKIADFKKDGHKKDAAKPAAAASKAPAAKAHGGKAAARAVKASPDKVAPAVATRSSTVAGIAKAHAAQLAKSHAPQRAVTAAVAKVPGQKISAPAPVVAHAPAATPVGSPKEIAEKAAAARISLAANKKPVSARHGFKTNQFVVYPAHGVGRIVGIEEQEIAGMSLELFVITFEKEKLTLRVPTGKLTSIGMRPLAEEPIVKRAMETLKGRARVKRQMWSRRAQEYVAKINSGDLISIAEVVRDLYRSEAQPEQSYSERQLYENALERMARELAAVEKMDERGAVQRIVEILSKSAKGRRLAAEAESAAEADGDVKAA